MGHDAACQHGCAFFIFGKIHVGFVHHQQAVGGLLRQIARKGLHGSARGAKARGIVGRGHKNNARVGVHQFQ